MNKHNITLDEKDYGPEPTEHHDAHALRHPHWRQQKHRSMTSPVFDLFLKGGVIANTGFLGMAQPTRPQYSTADHDHSLGRELDQKAIDKRARKAAKLQREADRQQARRHA